MTDSSIDYKLEVISEHISMLAEAPFWSDKQQKLLYVDCFRKELCLLDLSTKLCDRIATNVPAGSPETDWISAAIPIQTNSPDDIEKVYLVIAATKLYKYDSTTNELSMVHDTLSTSNTFNDGKCDPKGRLWVGFPKFDDLSHLQVTNEEGNLQCIDGKFSVKICDDKYSLPNGLAWNSDYTKLFWSDFIKRIIWAYDFDVDTMTLNNKRILFDFNNNAEYKEFGGFPDGLTTDLFGHLYIACWEGGRIAKVCTSTGALLETIKMPVSKVTSLCFGGNNYDQLLVTTASVGVDQVDVGVPDGGKIFRITSKNKNFKGFKQNCFVEIKQ